LIHNQPDVAGVGVLASPGAGRQGAITDAVPVGCDPKNLHAAGRLVDEGDLRVVTRVSPGSDPGRRRQAGSRRRLPLVLHQAIVAEAANPPLIIAAEADPLLAAVDPQPIDR